MKAIPVVLTPEMSSRQAVLVPRPDRLWQQLELRRRPAAISPLLVNEVLAAYGLRSEEPAVAAGSGRSVTVVVSTRAGKKLLKQYKPTIDTNAALHEHSILRYLAEVGFPAPRLCHTVDGASLLQYDNKCFALFDVLDGYLHYHNYWLWPWHKRRFVAASGAALGCLHETLWSFTPDVPHPAGFAARDGDRIRNLDWYLDQLRWCRGNPDLLRGGDSGTVLDQFTQHADWVEAQLVALDDVLGGADLPRTIIHGDYGPYNLFFKAGMPIVILDFELARLDWRLTDLATALPSFARSRLGFSDERMRVFLRAYCTQSPVDADELHWLPDVWLFLTLRRVVVCWQRRWARGERHWSEEAQRKLNWARWLLAHQSRLQRWLACSST